MRYLEAVLDEEPLLSEQLLELAEWMAQYYLAPLGEVLRGMLPLMAEVRRTVYYRITDLGRDVLAKRVEGDGSRFPGLKMRDLGHPATCGRQREAAGEALARRSRTWSGGCWSGWRRARR